MYGKKSRPAINDIDEYIENCEDLNGLFDEVLSELKKGNATRLKMEQLEMSLGLAEQKKEVNASSSEETYEEIILNCLRFLEINDLVEIERMTFYEYELRMKACRLKRVDEEYRIYLRPG